MLVRCHFVVFARINRQFRSNAIGIPIPHIVSMLMPGNDAKVGTSRYGNLQTMNTDK